jgi:hypothetical protein
MPKIANKKKAQNERLAITREANKKTPKFNFHGHCAVKRYPHTGIQLLIIGFCLFEHDDESNGEFCKILRDFIHFCLKSCENVTFIYQSKTQGQVLRNALGHLDSKVYMIMVDAENVVMQHEGHLNSRKSLYYMDGRNIMKKLILTGEYGDTLTGLEDNTMVITSNFPGAKNLYDDIIEFLKKFKTRKSIAQNIESSCNDSQYLTPYRVAGEDSQPFTLDEAVN